MHPSIPEGSWQVNADDPLALTRLLDLPDLHVLRLEYNDVQNTLHIFCQHTQDTARCPTCGQSSAGVHDYTRRVVRDLPWSGKPCLLELATRRFYCQECACPLREALPWVRRGSRLSERYRHHLFGLCRRTTIQAVSQEERIGYKTVERLYSALAQEQQPACPCGVRQLGIDEFAVKKGHDQFALALSDLETGRILAVLPNRKKETLLAHFASWTQEQRDAVTEVAMDLWEPYAQAVEACLPHARIVADRFHVMKNLTDQVTAARRDLQNTLPDETKPLLKGCRWLLVRNQADLADKDKTKLNACLPCRLRYRRCTASKRTFAPSSRPKATVTEPHHACKPG